MKVAIILEDVTPDAEYPFTVTVQVLRFTRPDGEPAPATHAGYLTEYLELAIKHYLTDRNQPANPARQGLPAPLFH
jgi:hypothetical protein